MQNLKKRLHGIGKITIEMMEKSFVCIQTHDKVHSQEIIDMDMIVNNEKNHINNKYTFEERKKQLEEEQKHRCARCGDVDH